jgi:hypothetical protein
MKVATLYARAYAERVLVAQHAKFAELRVCELLRNPIPRTRVNKGKERKSRAAKPWLVAY